MPMYLRLSKYHWAKTGINMQYFPVKTTSFKNWSRLHYYIDKIEQISIGAREILVFIIVLCDFVVSLFMSVRSDVTLLDNLKCIGMFCGVYDS